MRRRVDFATFVAPLKQRDAVATETPARRATVCKVGVVWGDTTELMFLLCDGRKATSRAPLSPRRVVVVVVRMAAGATDRQRPGAEKNRDAGKDQHVSDNGYAQAALAPSTHSPTKR